MTEQPRWDALFLQIQACAAVHFVFNIHFAANAAMAVLLAFAVAIAIVAAMAIATAAAVAVAAAAIWHCHRCRLVCCCCCVCCCTGVWQYCVIRKMFSSCEGFQCFPPCLS